MDQSSNSGPKLETGVSSEELAAVLRAPDTRITLSETGGLQAVSADGKTIDLPQADPLMAAFRARPVAVLDYFNAHRDELVELVLKDHSDAALGLLVSRIESGKETPEPREGSDGENGFEDEISEGRAVTPGGGNGLSSLAPLSGLSDSDLGQVSPLGSESAEFGRDDIKRGEVGASGQNVGTATGSGLGHLTGLGDDEPGLRNGEKISNSDNTRFTGLGTAVGSGVDHLWLLGDFEYYRAADDFLTVDPLLANLEGGQPTYGPLMREDLVFRSVEDSNFTGTLFDPLAFISVPGIATTMDPSMGTVTVNPDGSFRYTPANGFSGEATFTLQLTDPRTGEQINEVVTINVAAVADPIAISGAATTPEDTVVGIPVTLELGDPDGSETIEQVVISGIPTGSVFNWTANPNVNFALQPDGSYVVTGDTNAIVTTLTTLTLLPPNDFSGRITLGIDVRTAETNVPPGTEILVREANVHHDYIVDVVPVADIPNVTGDTDEVTPEDTRVLLDQLAGSLNDVDGSEVLTFEIGGVIGNAKLENTAGVEYPFTLQPDGSKTYRIPPANIGDVFFDPPPNGFGTFNMSITAIATEQANLDRATNTAPIQVRVTPVPDPIVITAPNAQVDEDGTVNIGGAIGITFGDPDGSEVLTGVTVSGFPQNAVITYTDVGGTPQTVTATTNGFSITLNGGTEAQIRAALATLSVRPPPHSDVNMPLNVAVAMIDGGLVTATNNADFVVRVAAVADTPTLTSPAHSGVEDQDIAVPFQVGHPDTDGTEKVESVVITGVPDGFILTGAAAGATLTNNGGGSYTVSGTTDAAINALLNTLVLDIQPGGARDDLDTNFSLGVSVTTVENAPTTSATPGHPDNPGGEVTTLRATDTFTLPVSVRPDVDLPTLGGSTTVNEDGIVNPTNQAVTAPINFGNNITISQNDSDDGSEFINSIVISNIPAGRTITYTNPAGTPVTHVVATDGNAITLTGGTEAQIRASLKTLTLVPIAHDDTDVALTIRVNKTDGTLAEAEAADNDSVTTTHTIVINAVADGPSFTAVSSGVEDTNIPFAITSTLVDQDGSETYDFVRLTLAPGADIVTGAPLPNNIQLLSANLLGDGRMEYRYAPGVGTTTAQFETFLRTGISVRPPLDSDVNFNVDIEIGTIESNPTEAGGFSLERLSRSSSVEVEVTPSVDTWSIASKTIVNEDGIVNPALAPTAPGNTQAFAFGRDIEAGITRGETAAGDTSEKISAITISGIPNLADLNFTTNANWTVDTGTAGQVTIRSTLTDPAAAETAIRVALLGLSLDPTAHSDADIPLNVAIQVTDTDPDDATDTLTQTFNGTHLIEVAAVADQPTGSGSGSGLEDQAINVSISVAHPDNADGSEEIRDVVIANVPAGLLLTGTAAGATLTPLGGGSYRVTGTSDAAINTLLGNLQLTIDPGDNSRLHLDTDFTLQVTATTIENNPTVDGHPGTATPAASEVSRLTNSVTFPVNVTVTAVADAVTHSGQSVVIEDTAATIGTQISYGLIDTDGTENITQVTVTGFAPGTIVNYNDVNGVPQGPLTIVTGTETLTFSGPKTAAGETAIRNAVNSIGLQAPPHSDVNFSLTVSATTTDNDASTQTTSWQHPVIVQAVADAPSIAADNITGNEDQRVALTIRADRSADGNTDNSETLSVRLTLPQESGNPIGTIVAAAAGPFTVATAGAVTTVSGAPQGDVTITDLGGGRYLVEGPGTGNAANDEAAIDAVLTGGVLNFDPRAQFSGTFSGTNGIRVEAISTETATLYGNTTAAPDDELAPNTVADPDTRTEIVETFLNVVINPVIDTPTFTGNSSLVRENNNDSDPGDPDLRFNLGSDLVFGLADRDGSQDLDLTLNGIPDTATVDFGGTVIAKGATQVINGVSVGVVDNLDGTISVTVDGVVDDGIAVDAADVLRSLHLTLADDNDKDFTVGISGTTTESLSGASASFTDSHQVTVQAVADRPTISGSGQGNEDTFIAVPITVLLNDTDGQAQGSGSETLQSVTITGIPTETGGTGVASGTPQVQFRIEGVTYDWASSAPISVTNADGSFTVNRATDGTLIFTPATAGSAGDTRAIQSALLTLQIKRGDHVGDDYTLSVAAVAVESNPSEANNNGPGVAGDQISVPTATTTTTVSVDVIPVTDPIAVTSPALVNIDEDDVRDENGDGVTGVRLSTLFNGHITQHDRDGSETLSYQVTGLTGGTFTAGSFNAGSNTWSFTAAQYASAIWRPAAHRTGTFTGTLRAFTQDQANAGTAAAVESASAAFSVTVHPDPDRPNLSGSSTIYEDKPGGVGSEGNFGQDITYSLVDTDGSETITKVVIDTTTLPANWVISFNNGATFTTLNTGGTLPAGVVHAGGVFTITGSTAQIDAAVDAFVVAAPANSDANANVRVSVTTTDTTDTNFTLVGDDTDNDGNRDTATRTRLHPITTLAIADTPDIQAGFIVEGNENATFTLQGTGGETLQADRSADTDGVSDSAGWGSEQLSVQITGVPDGVVLSGTGVSGTSGTFTVSAANEDQLNARLDAIQVAPGNWSGIATLTITAIATEQGEGGGGTEIHVPTATDVDTLTLRVLPQVDTPTITGNAIGTEDTNIKVPLRVDLADRDGSETLDHVLISGLPAGAAFVNASGVALGTDLGGGVFQFTPAEMANLHVRPPLNWSSELGSQGDITLQVQATITDTAATGSQTLTTLPAVPITVEVQEDADPPKSFPVTVSGNEDEPYALGQGILAAAGATTVAQLSANTLNDTDTSETLSFVIKGLPSGVIPTSSTGTVAFLGGGQWSVTADAIPNLVLPADPNYSGSAPYSGASIKVIAVSQEIAGDQANSPEWNVAINVSPVINAGTVDGLVNWNPKVTVTEAKDAAAGTNIALTNARVTAANFRDNDGSEEIISYTFDFTNLVGDAQVLLRVRELMGNPAATPTEARDWLTANGIVGTPGLYTDNGNGTITVSATLDGAGEITTTAESKLAGLSLLAAIFDDSDVDFSFPVSVSVRDRADLAGGPVDVFKTENTTFNVELKPIADTPSVSAQNPDNTGNSADVDTFGFTQLIPLVLGGDTTDRDSISLGRAQSEQIHYILTLNSVTGGSAPDIVLLNSGNAIIGLDNGDGSWLLTAADLADINIYSLPFSGLPRTLTFTLTTVAFEGDSFATNSAGGEFQLIIDPGAGGTIGDPPPLPVLNLGALLGQTEDTKGSLANAGTPFVTPGDGPDPDTLPDAVASIAVMFEVPTGVEVEGATFNPVKNRWVADYNDFNNGLVTILPPKNSSTPIEIKVQAVAVGTNFVQAETPIQTIMLPVTAVADAPSVSGSASGAEDQAIALTVNVNLSDNDGSEVVGSHVYIKLDNGATLLGGHPVVTEVVDGVTLAGYYKVPSTSLGSLQIQGAADWHGTVRVDVAATSAEQSNGDVALRQTSFNAAITADADAPAVTVPVAAIMGVEDTQIDLSGLLSVTLNDLVATNGGEILSVLIEDVPEGTLFSAGSNNGDNTWTIPVAALATLKMTPPTNYAGNMTLKLTGIALESSNGDNESASASFTLEISPRADSVEVLPQDATISVSGRAELSLDVRMSDNRGTLTGEQGPEQVEITFRSVPSGVALEARSGGSVVDNGGGEFVFTGTQDQANALAFAASATAAAGTSTVQVASVVTIDGADRNTSGFTDTFTLTVPQVLSGNGSANVLSGGSGTQLLYGLGGIDVLSGGGGADGLFGGAGADILTGGGGGDVFGWEAGDLDGNADIITDFSIADGDAIDISDVLVGFDDATSVLGQFVRLTEAAGNTTVAVDFNGGGDSYVDIAVLTGTVGLDAETMRTNDNLIV